MQIGHSGVAAAGPVGVEENLELELVFVVPRILLSQLIVLLRCVVNLFHGRNGLPALFHASLGNRRDILPPLVRHPIQLIPKQDHVMQDLVLPPSGLLGAHAVKLAVQVQDSEKEVTLALVNFLMM